VSRGDASLTSVRGLGAGLGSGEVSQPSAKLLGRGARAGGEGGAAGGTGGGGRERTARGEGTEPKAPIDTALAATLGDSTRVNHDMH